MIDGARLLVLGKQGAGKGTQCERLARHFDVPHVSSGDVLRAAVKQGTELGKAAQRFMIKGDLVPDALVIGAVAERLAAPDAVERGFILDGFPRTGPQARALAEFLQPAGIDAAIDIDVPSEVVVRRLAARRVCSTCGKMAVARTGEATVPCLSCGGEAEQRADDTVDAIARRLALYEEQTRPLLEGLANHDLLATVDGMGTPDEVERRIHTAIRPFLAPRMAEAG